MRSLKQWYTVIRNHPKPPIPAVIKPRPKKWYEGWGIKTELYAKNRRQVIIELPNSGNPSSRVMLIKCSASDQIYDLIDLVDSALSELTNPTVRLVEDKHLDKTKRTKP